MPRQLHAERSAFHSGTRAKLENGDNLNGADWLSTGISCVAPGYPPRFGSVVHRITALIVCEQLAMLKRLAHFRENAVRNSNTKGIPLPAGNTCQVLHIVFGLSASVRMPQRDLI